MNPFHDSLSLSLSLSDRRGGGKKRDQKKKKKIQKKQQVKKNLFSFLFFV